jgi:hypothetical protein
MGKKVLMILIAGMLISGLAFSQIDQTCSISGVVRTPERGALSGVIVLLKSPVLDLPEVEAVTNASGMYGFPCLSPGTYELTIIFSGLQHVDLKGIVVSEGESVTLDIDLPLRAKDEAVLVEGDLPKLGYERILTPGIRISMFYRGSFTLVLKSFFYQPTSLPL